MGKLEYYFGTMASAKSGKLLMTCHQYMDCGAHCILLKPSFDSRDKEGHINSRAVQSKPCTLINTDTNIVELVNSLLDKKYDYTCVLVDEVQFLTTEQINQLWQISRNKEFLIDVQCYGLKTTYTNELFEASSKLLVLADKTYCLPSMCSFCHNEATTHLRIINGVPVKQGHFNIIGDINKSNEYYKSVCQSCYNNPPENL